MKKWHTQEGNITTNIKVKIYFTSPELSAKKTAMWNCHVDYSSKGRYGIILVIYLFKYLGLNIKFSEKFTKADDGPLKVSTSPVVDLGTCEFKDLNIGKLHPNNCL